MRTPPIRNNRAVILVPCNGIKPHLKGQGQTGSGRRQIQKPETAPNSIEGEKLETTVRGRIALSKKTTVFTKGPCSDSQELSCRICKRLWTGPA